MTASSLLQLSRAARTRSVANDLLIGLPLAALATIAAWRFSGMTSAVLIAVVGMTVLIALAAWHARDFDQRWLVRQLNTRRNDLEDSTDLLLADAATLNPLQQLQRARLQERLNTGTAPDLRAPWSSSRIAATWITGAIGIAALLYWPTPQATSDRLAPSAEQTPVVAGVPRLVAQRLRITPPGYTGLPVRNEASLDAKAPQGSRLQWTLHFEPQPQAADMVFHDGTRLALVRDGEDWSAQRLLERSVLYRVQPRTAQPQPATRLYRLDAIADRPPQIKVITPDRSLSLVTAGQRRWPLLFEVSDDHGVAASAQLRITLAQGEGENITFREQTLNVRGTGNATLKRFSPQLDLAALGFAVGDDLVAQLGVSDNRAPNPQLVRSPSLILRWPSDLGNESTGLDGMVKKVLPAYFRSQRQIIIDAEALLKEKKKLSADKFVERSDAIGVDQRILRLRYGQFLGEESEGQAKLPTNDAEENSDQHTDDHTGEEEHPPGDTQAGAVPTDDHDHAAGQTREAFGNEATVLEEYGHTHDHAEAATLLDPETRATLKRALDQMWQSELHLRQGDPQQALPYAYKALGFIKQVQQATRIFLARVGPELPPIDEARRLTGDRAGLVRRELGLAALDDVDVVPATMWRALEEAPGAAPVQWEPQLQALERWLRGNESRVTDPLAFVAAIDAVRGDPQCIACRRTLRGLLWTALSRPPAHVPRREQGDASGTRYLDALREGSGE
ncbi:MAG: hypothetical protein ABI858_01345 [Pseudoxanthomonas sp.]